jgi:hypothetical protein
MTVIEVKDRSTRKIFLDVARFVYKNDEVWVCPLDMEVEAVFDPAKNNFHQHGKCIRWILLNEQQQAVGRIAAFINQDKAYHYEQPTGGIGFFECIDNKDYAFLLFDTAKNWLIQQRMKAMDGPINFGENDSFWGLLVEGFTQPSYGMTYNPPITRHFLRPTALKHYISKSPTTWRFISLFPNVLPKLPTGLRKSRVTVLSI